MKILISRTDNIGDMVLTLPMAGVIKKHIPHAEIFFLGKSYTAPVVSISSDVDGFLNWDEIGREKKTAIKELSKEKFDVILHVFPNKDIAKCAKIAKIPLRIGTNRRAFHLLTCNRLVDLSRKNARLHESQLNLKLLKGLGIKTHYELTELHPFYGVGYLKLMEQDKSDGGKKIILLHPKSKGSARDWSPSHFISLAKLLLKKEFTVIFTGAKEEQSQIEREILSPEKWGDEGDPHTQLSNVTNLVGQLTLTQLISLIGLSHGVVAASTGPLHIAAALGKCAVGIYPPKKSMDLRRWGPVGPKARALAAHTPQEFCHKPCGQGENPTCSCMELVSPKSVVDALLEFL